MKYNIKLIGEQTVWTGQAFRHHLEARQASMALTKMLVQSASTLAVFFHHLFRLLRLMFIVGGLSLLIVANRFTFGLLHLPFRFSHRSFGLAAGAGSKQKKNRRKNYQYMKYVLFSLIHCVKLHQKSSQTEAVKEKNAFFCNKEKNMSQRILSFLLVISSMVLLPSCWERNANPNAPKVHIDFEITPNSLMYHDLNTISGYMYLTSEYPSRGIIVYRVWQNEFKAYDRIPPNDPYACCNGDTCSRLVVDLPFVVDHCNNIKYNIIDGSIVEGTGVYPLIEYYTEFDGVTLRIHN